MSENTVNGALRRVGYSGEEIVAHGFRSTASTNLNEQGWRYDVIERQLAHVERNESRRPYNKAEYLKERTAMMQAWADFLDALRESQDPTGISAAIAALFGAAREKPHLEPRRVACSTRRPGEGPVGGPLSRVALVVVYRVRFGRSGLAESSRAFGLSRETRTRATASDKKRGLLGTDSPLLENSRSRISALRR